MRVWVLTLNATIQASELLMQTTEEQKSINNTKVHSKKKKKKDVILVQRVGGKSQGEKQQGWTPARKDIFSQRKTIPLFYLL